MSSAKVFIFAPVEEARDSHRRLEAEGCELRLGKASWDTPQGHGEPELIRMAQGAHALMGTSIRNVPISRKIMESSPELRVVGARLESDAQPVAHRPTRSRIVGEVAQRCRRLRGHLRRRLVRGQLDLRCHGGRIGRSDFAHRE